MGLCCKEHASIRPKVSVRGKHAVLIQAVSLYAYWCCEVGSSSTSAEAVLISAEAVVYLDILPNQGQKNKEGRQSKQRVVHAAAAAAWLDRRVSYSFMTIAPLSLHYLPRVFGFP